MEIGKIDPISIMFLPVKRFYDYLKWKSDLEEEKSKLIETAKNQSNAKKTR
jgi:hypothetical protein